MSGNMQGIAWMKQQKSFLVRTVLASTLFCLQSSPTYALVDIPANTTTDSNATPDGGAGYNFAGSNSTLEIIAPNNVVGKTPILIPPLVDFSVDNNFPNVGVPFSDVELQFAGTATVQGSIGIINPITLITFNTGNVPGNIVTLQSQVYRGLSSNVQGTGGTNIVFNFLGAGNSLIEGDFTTNNNNIDVISFDNVGNTTVSGQIGTQTNTFSQILLSSATTLTFNQDVYANKIAFNANGTIEFDDNANAYGPITTAAGGTGTLNYLGNSTILFPIGTQVDELNLVNFQGGAGKTVLLTDNIFATTVNLNNGGLLYVSDLPTIEATDFFINNGTLSIANNDLLTVQGNITFKGAPTTLVVDMDGDLTTTGVIKATGQANMDPNTNVTILNPGFSPAKATVIPILQGVGGVINPPVITNANTFLTRFSTQIVGDTLNLIVTSQPLTNFATNSNIQGVAQALDIIAAGGPTTDSLESIIAQLSTFTDIASLNNALATLAPIVDGAIMTESFNTQNMIFGAIGDRMDRMNFWLIHDKQANKNKAKKGISAGDIFETDNGLWIKMLYQHGNQKERDQIIGYNNHTWGFTVGADTMITEQSMVGASVSWTDLDVNNHVSVSKTNANSYQGTLYTAIDFNCPLFFNGYVGVAYNNYITSRNIVFNDFAFFPRGHFHGLQSGAKAEVGYVFGTDIHVIPLASLYYSHLSIRGYQETNASTTNQIINGANFDTLLGGLGIKFADDYTMNDYMLLQSEVHAMAVYDVIGDQMQLTSQFTGSGPSFITQGFTPAKASFDIGASLTLFTHYDFTLSANYDFAFKDDYTSNSGFMRVRYEW